MNRKEEVEIIVNQLIKDLENEVNELIKYRANKYRIEQTDRMFGIVNEIEKYKKEYDALSK